jgi:hypothetical protein
MACSICKIPNPEDPKQIPYYDNGKPIMLTVCSNHHGTGKALKDYEKSLATKEAE